MKESKNTILVVDDEPEIRKMLHIFLDAVDFKVVQCDTGKQALRMAASVKPNLMLLDLILPDMNGKDIICDIRQWSQLPIVVLSAKSEEEEVVAALNAGADDYVTKPFGTEELLARINANLRKGAVREAGETELVNGPICMNLVRHEVSIGGEKITFTPKEYALLRLFLMNCGRMITRRQILKEIWGPAHVEDAQYLRVYIGQLREKLDAIPGLKSIIVSEAGVGYRMDSASPWCESKVIS